MEGLGRGEQATGAPRCDEVAAILAEGTAAEAVARLVEELRGEPRQYLEARLLQARLELGMELLAPGSLGEIPEAYRAAYEARYVSAIREVATGLLERGDLLGAWPYFRAIGEPESLAHALELWEPEDGDARLAGVIDLALHQGVHPLRGFQLVLKHYGPCAAITAYEGLPVEESVRAAGAEALINVIYEQLRTSLRAEIARHGEPEPAESVPVRDLIRGRDWLFEDEAYHTDISHLSAVVRMAPWSGRSESLEKARELCSYGERLSPRLRYEGEVPFERTYEDHGVYFEALLGRDVDRAVGMLSSKLGAAAEQGDEVAITASAAALVRLFDRTGRLEEAISVAAKWLKYSVPGVPTIESLCRRAGTIEPLRLAAIEQDDPVRYATAVLALRKLAGEA
jgi:hypothetical protein